MDRVLVIEDSMDTFALIRHSLGSSYHLDWAKTVTEAGRLLKKKRFDMILLDVTLPDGDGFQFCSMMQADADLKDAPVIFLTARNTVEDKVLGFSVGADDFLVKPFDPLELRARINARIRRKGIEKSRARLIRIGDLEIDTDAQKVSVSNNGHMSEIDLTPIEFKILSLLAKNGERVLSRNEVLSAVWGADIHVYSRSVDTHVSKLRKKLGAHADCIESVHGAGYRVARMEQGSDGQGMQAHGFMISSSLVAGERQAF